MHLFLMKLTSEVVCLVHSILTNENNKDSFPEIILMDYNFINQCLFNLIPLSGSNNTNRFMI